MEHGFPLARLARLVAETRASGRTMRLVARNTERFGVVHLYFVRGRLAQVEGHAGSPLASISDLAGWRYGVVRQDASAAPSGRAAADPRLDAALDDTLRRLMAAGVVQPISLPTSWPSAPSSNRPSSPFASHISPPPAGPPSIGSGGLPPLSHAPATASGAEVAGSPSSAGSAATKTARTDALTAPQWQMVALVVHQVVEGAGAFIGIQMAEGLLQQALTFATRSHPVLLDLTLDTGGWLKACEDDAIARYSTYDVTDAIAALLTGFELRCASLTGAARAQDVILVAAAPFRTALAQIGLDISA
ncbi:MAG TPA: hypothetical protein VKT52_03675 [Ktedonobacterales bacterium]|nr:hypothetical protein [Ktedonobacterales bacterium]